MELTVSKTSPYVNGQVTVYADKTYSLDPPQDPRIYHNKSGEDVNHEVVHGQTLESLSDLYYKTSAYWHQISTYNPQIWDFENLEPGTIIIIPHPTKFKI